MACVLPPELDDRTLLAFIDGEADSQVEAHLAQCPHCYERANRLARFQERLRTRLCPLECPPSIELGEYHLGMLSRAQEAKVARHLKTCSHCVRELAQLRDFLASLRPESKTLKEIKRVLEARRTRSSGNQLGFTALAPARSMCLRGEEQQGPDIYQVDDVQVAVQVQDDAEKWDHKAILGLITGMDTHAWTAQLWQAEQCVATVPVDDFGNFSMPNLALGHYKLILSGPKVEVHIQDLKI